MRTRLLSKICLLALLVSPVQGQLGHAAGENFNQGVNLYKAGRYSEATDAFEAAIKHHDQGEESQRYIDRIRKELVERIRNRALTGVSKTSWVNKYYFMNNVNGRVQV